MEPRRKLGRYSLLAEIARGATGVVYLAATTEPPAVSAAGARASRPPLAVNGHALYVLKRLRPDLAAEPRFRGMFLDEARLAMQLVHRNIVHTHEVGEDGERLWLVMDYLEGRTLRSALRLRGEQALPLPTLLRIVCAVLAGLHHAHEVTDREGAPLGVVHRDVSPHNVFLTYDGQVKVLDFGVAQAFGRTTVTEPGGLKGRIAYMAPERVMEAEITDRRADVFSVGALLREALTGAPVWDRPEVEVLRDLLARKIPPLPADAAIAPELREIVERAMAPEKEHRFKTAHAMRAAIEQWVVRHDPGGSLATMGPLLERAFAVQRAHARRVIDDHFAARGLAPASGLELPSFPSSSAEIAAAIASSLPPPTTSEPPPEVVLEGLALGQPPLGLSAAPRAPLASDAGFPLLDVQPEPGPAPPPPAPPPRRRRTALVAAALMLAFAGAAGGALLLHRRPPPPAPSGGASLAIVAASATAPAEDPLELRVVVKPAHAQIILDDNVVGAAAWRGLLPRDSEHAIRVVAAGHTPKTSRVKLDRALTMTIELDPAAAAAPSGPVVVAGPKLPRPAASPARSEAPAAAGSAAPSGIPVTAPAAMPGDAFGAGARPARTIDPKSPYD